MPSLPNLSILNAEAVESWFRLRLVIPSLGPLGPPTPPQEHHANLNPCNFDGGKLLLYSIPLLQIEVEIRGGGRDIHHFSIFEGIFTAGLTPPKGTANSSHQPAGAIPGAGDPTPISNAPGSRASGIPGRLVGASRSTREERRRHGEVVRFCTVPFPWNRPKKMAHY